jgi:anti-sigma factor RsiW
VADKRTDQKQFAHLSSEDIAAFVDNRVSIQERENIMAHLANCIACRKLVAQVVSSRKQVRDADKRNST